MFNCGLLAGVLMCTPITAPDQPVQPVNFDLAQASGSYQKPRLEPAVLFFYTPPTAPSRWSLASTESPWKNDFAVRDQYTPGFTIRPARMILRFTFDVTGTQAL